MFSLICAWAVDLTIVRLVIWDVLTCVGCWTNSWVVVGFRRRDVHVTSFSVTLDARLDCGLACHFLDKTIETKYFVEYRGSLPDPMKSIPSQFTISLTEVEKKSRHQVFKLIFLNEKCMSWLKCPWTLVLVIQTLQGNIELVNVLALNSPQSHYLNNWRLGLLTYIRLSASTRPFFSTMLTTQDNL